MNHMKHMNMRIRRFTFGSYNNLMPLNLLSNKLRIQNFDMEDITKIYFLI